MQRVWYFSEINVTLGKTPSRARRLIGTCTQGPLDAERVTQGVLVVDEATI